MRRRRRPRVVWLPLQQADSIRADQLSSAKYGVLPLNTATAGNGAHIEFPLVADGIGQGQDPLVVTNSLADIEQSGYRLRRVVGKLFIQSDMSSVINDGVFGTAIVTAGLMVRREDNLTGLSLALTAGTQEVAVDATRNISDPWIWRRSWIVGDPGNNGIDNTPTGVTTLDQNAAGTHLVTSITPNNWSHGPALGDGPHVDAKTARIIGPEERLFLDVSARTLWANSAGQSAVLQRIFIAFDLRILGSMRTNSGNRKNSNR